MIYASDVDIIPDYPNKTLTVKLHNLNYRRDDKVAQYLCEKLNETEIELPGTDLKIIYQLVSSWNPVRSGVLNIGNIHILFCTLLKNKP